MNFLAFWRNPFTGEFAIATNDGRWISVSPETYRQLWRGDHKPQALVA